MNGTALGGGLEIALACHHRVAIADPKAEFGLPEATLGLLPGGNGIVRTVRLLGLQKAVMDVLLQGTRFKAEKAKSIGLIDELVPDAATMMAKARTPRSTSISPVASLLLVCPPDVVRRTTVPAMAMQNSLRRASACVWAPPSSCIAT